MVCGNLEGPKVTHLADSHAENPILKWDHLIDSRPPTGVDDQGSFAALENGDVTETGRMFNPNTGDIEDYVETWRRFPASPGAPYCVLELDGEADGAIGYLGRVGDNALGCGKPSSGDYVAWREEKGKRMYEFGPEASMLPRLPSELPKDWKEGSRCELGDRTFVVRAIGLCT